MKFFLFAALVLTVAVQLAEQQPRRNRIRRTRRNRPIQSVALAPPVVRPARTHYVAVPPPLFRPAPQQYVALPPALVQHARAPEVIAEPVEVNRIDDLNRRRRRGKGKGKRGKNAGRRPRPTIGPLPLMTYDSSNDAPALEIATASDAPVIMIADSVDIAETTENTIRV